MTTRSMGLCVALLVSSSGGGGATPTQRQGVTAPPGLAVIFVRPAVDHLVIYSFSRGFGPKGGDRAILLRHGNLVRTTTEYVASKRDFEPASRTSYSNIATNATVQGELRGPAEISGFTFWREDKTKPGRNRYNLAQTDETRTVAGERCAIWRADPIGEPHSMSTGVPHRACITDDGIVLYDAWLYSSGEVAEERTAIKVERREVTSAEVLPPSEALNWQAWIARAANLQPKRTGRPSNFDLQLKKQEISWDDGPDRVRFRASGGWELQEEWSKGKLSQFRMYHSSSALTAHWSSDQLEFHFTPSPKVAPWDSGTQPLDRRPVKTLLGQQCRWFDTTVNVMDYSRHECRAHDGLPLTIEEASQGDSGSTLVAMSADRGTTLLREMVPPRSLLNWTAWGWPEMDRPERGGGRIR